MALMLSVARFFGPVVVLLFALPAFASYDTAVFTAANYYCGQRRAGNGNWHRAFEDGIEYGISVWGPQAGKETRRSDYRRDVYKKIGSLCPQYSKPFGSRAK